MKMVSIVKRHIRIASIYSEMLSQHVWNGLSHIYIYGSGRTKNFEKNQLKPRQCIILNAWREREQITNAANEISFRTFQAAKSAFCQDRKQQIPLKTQN